MLLDSFAPEARSSVLEHAANHCSAVWVLRQDNPSPGSVADMSKIRSLHACLVAILPSQSLVVHAVNGWSNAKWDSEPSKYASQLWHLQSTTGLNGLSPSPDTVQHLLGCWKSRRYDVYHCVDPVSQQLLHYRAGQQDAILYTGQGLFQ